MFKRSLLVKEEPPMRFRLGCAQGWSTGYHYPWALSQNTTKVPDSSQIAGVRWTNRQFWRKTSYTRYTMSSLALKKQLHIIFTALQLMSARCWAYLAHALGIAYSGYEASSAIYAPRYIWPVLSRPGLSSSRHLSEDQSSFLIQIATPISTFAGLELPPPCGVPQPWNWLASSIATCKKTRKVMVSVLPPVPARSSSDEPFRHG
jgi:hypothetical protein